jgi:hypothetical protein
MSIGITQDDNAQVGGRNELPASQAVEGFPVPERHGLGVRKTRSYDTFCYHTALGHAAGYANFSDPKLACHVFAGLYWARFAREGLRQLPSPDCDSCLDHLGSRSAKQVSHDASVSRLNCWP